MMHTTTLRFSALALATSFAVLGATSTSALAAETEIYGQIDTGFYAVDSKGKNPSLEMKPSIDASSYWGLRGRETLGETGYVRFVLESGFEGDTGRVANDTRSGALFSREAMVVLGREGTGEIALGRMAGFLGSTGTYAQWAATGMNPLASNAPDAALAGVFQSSPIMDNAIVVKSAPMHGVTLLGQFSNSTNQATYPESEGFSNTEHLYALAAGWKGENATALLAWQMIDYANTANGAQPHNAKPTHNIFAGASRGFGDLRVHVAYQHLENARGMLGVPSVISASSMGFNGAASRDGFRADAFSIGGSTTLLGGRLHGSVKMVTGEWRGERGAAADTEGERWVGALRWAYRFSKRTGFYVLGTYAYANGMFENTDASNAIANRATAAAGLTHKF